MRLTDRDLSNGNEGGDVRLLHRELRLLDVDIPADELERHTFGDGTREAVLRFQQDNALAPTGTVDSSVARAINARVASQPRRLVLGAVRDRHGAPLAKVVVRAFDRRVGVEDLPLGQATAAADGTFEIPYEAAALGRRDKRRPDLVVTVASGQDELLFTSEVRYDAEPVDMFDITIERLDHRGASEYERLADRLQRAAGRDVLLASLTDRDVEFLAGRTGVDRQQVAWVVESAQRAAATSYPAELFFALARGGISPTAPLLALGADRVSSVIEAAVRENVVPATVVAAAERFVSRGLPSMSVDELLRARRPGEGASLGDLLATSIGDADKRRVVAEVFAGSNGNEEAFWAAIGRRRDFRNTPEVQRLRTTFDFGVLAGNHLPLVSELQRRTNADDSLRTLRGFAKYGMQEWQEVVAAAGVPADTPGATRAEKAAAYAHTLAHAIERRFPTAVLASRIERGDLALPADRRADLLTFFKNNAQFEFGEHYLQAFVAEGGGANLGGIVASRIPAVKADLGRIDRALKMVPADLDASDGFRHQAVTALLAAGFDSALTVVRLGRRDFVEQLQHKLPGGPKQAYTIYNLAEENATAALALISKYSPAFHGLSVPVLSTPTAPQLLAGPPPASGIPDLRTLFGSIDFCGCEHCQSVFSPAAYLVDLLKFLADRPSKTPNTSVKAVLFKWRPDIGETELTCANTNTPLPYVDLVNEVLENAVSPPPANTAFPQTTWTAEELAANPEHVNTAAYVKLRQAQYPWTLPFDFSAAETATYLGALATTRRQLMDALRPAERYTSAVVAREVLGLSQDEAALITNSNPTEPWTLWELSEQVTGLRDRYDGSTIAGPIAWDVALRDRVSVLLQQSGLEYSDLLNLFELRYINPTAVTPSIAGDPCNLSKMSMPWLNAAALGRIHRFTRLWRRLGWSPFDLDRAIVAFGSGDITPDFLLWLSHVRRLTDALNVPASVVFSWWASIDTKTYRDHRRDGAAVPSQYDGIFLSRSVTSPPVRALALNAARTELAVPYNATAPTPADPSEPDPKKQTFTDRKAAVLAAAGITARELGLLVPSPIVDELTLANLSALYRIATFARAVGVTVAEWLRLKAISGLDPLPTAVARTTASAATRQFVDEIGAIRRSGFTLDELDYLLRHDPRSAALVGVADEDMAARLEELRSGLQGIAEVTRPQADPSGELTRAMLGRLGWHDELVEFLVGDQGLGSAVPLEAPLAALPPGVAFPTSLPAALATRVSFDATNKKVVVIGGLRAAEHMTLLNLPATQSGAAYQAYKSALDAVRQATAAKTAILAWRMQSWTLPAFSAALEFTAPLAALPAGVLLPDDLPAELRTRVTFDAAQGQLRVKGLLSANEASTLTALAPGAAAFAAAVNVVRVPVVFPKESAARFYYDPADYSLHYVGWMTDAERRRLRALATAPPYQAAVDALFQASTGYTESDPRNRFLTAANAEAIVCDTSSISGRFDAILASLLPYLRRRDSRQLTVHMVAQTFGVPVPVSAQLLERINRRGQSGQPALEAFLDPQFADSSITLAVSRRAFPEPFAVLTQLHKATMLLTRLAMTADDVAGLLEPADWTFLNGLPLSPVESGASRFAGWRRLIDLGRLRNELSGGATSLRRVYAASRDTAATAATVRTLVSQLLQWNNDDLTYAADATRLNLTTPSAYRDPGKLLELKEAIGAISRLGVSAEQGWRWTEAVLQPEDGAAARQAARARLGSQWRDQARALRDPLRERQRAALVDYLVATTPLRDPNELYGQYLIDVEMSPCMMTSRIKQATNSVQLFVQRVLMNLESTVAPTAIDVDQWKWMKNYRVWEANRKIFIHPENWLEPELRSDKSPFFTELESELQQIDAGGEKVEKAFLNYLEKLEHVSRLEIAGFYREKQGGTNERLHVFGRTFTEPRAYYYRQLVDQSYWTAWEKVEVDVEGDHLVPAIWNQRLYLFWPAFREISAEPTTFADPFKPKAPEKQWEVKLAWSERRNGKWTAKRLSDPLFTAGPTSDFPPRRMLFAALADSDAVAIAGAAPGLSSTVERVVRGNGPVLFQPDAVIAGSAHLIAPGTDHTYNAFVEQRTTGQGPLKLREATNVGGALDRTKLTNYFDVLQRNPTGGNDRFRLVFPQQPESLVKTPKPNGLFYLIFVIQDPYFFEDSKRTYYARPVEYYDAFRALWAFSSGLSLQQAEQLFTYRGSWFSTHFHPYLPEFKAALATKGLPGLLSLDVQRLADSGQIPSLFSLLLATTSVAAGATFWNEYRPVPGPVFSYSTPKEIVEFGAADSYALYNWELFFHAPVLIATRLSRNQRFDEAQRWFHFIFDPTDNSAGPEPARFWRVRPFYEAGQATPIQELMALLADKTNTSPARQDLVTQVKQWRKNPFQPHLIARWRTSAYQWSVLMKYVDNLIAWGDQLFRRDTIESINEATQLYVLADQILGRRPERLPQRLKPQLQTYNSVEPKLDEFANALVQAESLVVPSGGSGGGSGQTSLPILYTLLFCVPHNQNLLDYWARVSDRLFKIRHCMNIEGVVRALPLFEPPIEPGLLARAAAAGVDLTTALGDANAPPPLYRFTVLAQRARELCGEVKALGSALLGALEKRDAEGLALMRSAHELSTLAAARRVRDYQVEEARAAIETAGASLQIAQVRCQYYIRLLSELETVVTMAPTQPRGLRLAAALADVITTVDPRLAAARGALELTKLIVPEVRDAVTRLEQAISRVGESGVTEQVTVPMNALEKRHLDELKSANEQQLRAMDYEAIAQILALIPDITLGAQGISSPVVQAQIGGTLLSTMARVRANQFNYESSEHSYRANLHSILGGYQRRALDWLQQAQQAAGEVEQIGKQILGAGIRLAIANQEVANHDLQIEHAKEIDAVMRDKYTNADLYDWMIGQLSAVYLASYQLAYDAAKRAERAYRFELGLRDSNFVQFGYWDNLKKGLLAGEQLQQDLNRLEAAYFDQNKREYELTKHVSLLSLDPMALLRLKMTGRCEVSLPEALFDVDQPAGYLRRLKSVAVSIPSILGTYTTVSCKLTLVKSSVRTTNTTFNGAYGRSADDPRFVDEFGAIQSVVTSGAQMDAGLFEANLRDERYLPFEGRGAISTWQLELPDRFRQFDYETITDVVLHVRYTARDGGEGLARLAVKELESALTAIGGSEYVLSRFFSLRHEFPTAWQRFMNVPDAQADHELTVDLTADRFPFIFQGAEVKIGEALILLKLRRPEGYRNYTKNDALPVTLAPPAGTAVQWTLAPTSLLGRLPYKRDQLASAVTVLGQPQAGTKWKLTVDSADIKKIHASLRRDVTVNNVTYYHLEPQMIEDIGLVCFYSAKLAT
jgi:hypothetical protein